MTSLYFLIRTKFYKIRMLALRHFYLFLFIWHKRMTFDLTPYCCQTHYGYEKGGTQEQWLFVSSLSSKSDCCLTGFFKCKENSRVSFRNASNYFTNYIKSTTLIQDVNNIASFEGGERNIWKSFSIMYSENLKLI